MKQKLLFILIDAIAYPFVVFVITWLLAGIIPTRSQDAPGAGMEQGYRFFLLAILLVVVVFIVSLILSKRWLAVYWPALAAPLISLFLFFTVMEMSELNRLRSNRDMFGKERTVSGLTDDAPEEDASENSNEIQK